MNPKISVVIPVYNCEQYIERCVRSIQRQTLKEIEIILVNDGSSDNSLDLCYSCQKSAANIVVVNQDNGGASKARSAGVKIAKGEYIGFIDSDDWIDEDMYMSLYRIAKTGDADIVQCGFITTSDPTDHSIHPCQELSWDTETGSNALSELLCGEAQCRFNYLLWNKIYKRALFSQFEYPTEVKTINDVPVIPRLFYYAERVSFTEQPFVYYFDRNDENSKSIMDSLKQSKTAMIFSHIEAFGDVADYFHTVDTEVYKKSRYLLTVWTCSGLISRKNAGQRKLIRDIIMRHQLFKCKHAGAKRRIACLLAYFWYSIVEEK